jgi:hypothetical protein
VRWLFGAVLAWLLAVLPLRAGSSAVATTFRDSGIQIEVETLYDDWPATGFVPCQVRITNDQARAHSWTMTAQEQTFGQGRRMSSFAFTVEARSRREFSVLVPMNSIKDTAMVGYRSMQVQFQGYGVGGDTLHLGQKTSGGHRGTRFTLMDAQLAVENWGPLEAHLAKTSSPLHGSRIEAAAVPADALAFLGVESLWLSRAAWQKLRAEQRHAIEGWLQGGGRLMLCDDAPPEKSLAREALGQGEIKEVQTQAGRIASELFQKETEPHGSTWSLASGGTVEKGTSWIGGFAQEPERSRLLIFTVLLFGLLVGPINLFVFARGPRRHLIFLTTPILCLGASGIGAGAIYLRDGLGGEGRRAALIQVLEDRHEVRIVQEQVARTGLLLRRGFQMAETAYLAPLRSGDEGPLRNTALRSEGTHYSGDWFRSRWVQAQQAVTVRPSRAGMSIQRQGDTLIALSSYEGTLDEIFVRDAEGKLWHGRDLQPGRPLSLATTTQATFDKWRRTFITPGPVTRERLGTVGSERNLWIASGPGTPADFIATHPSIRWKEQRVILFGEARP